MAINTQGFGIQLATPGFSLEANTIFTSYNDALAYAQSSAAYVGKVISVTEGVEKGLYTIEAIGPSAQLKKVGTDVDLSNYVTQDQLSTIYKYKGSKTTFNDLPVVDVNIGDVWNVEEAHNNHPAGTNWAWTGSDWDPLAGTVDLSGYAIKSDVESQLTTITENIAKNTGAVGVLHTELQNKVDKVEGHSLISDDKLLLVDASATKIGELITANESLDSRLKVLEGTISGEGVDLSEVTARIDNHDSRISTLESDNTSNKNAITSLQEADRTLNSQLESVVELNTQQTGQIAGLTTELGTLNTTVSGHTSEIVSINTTIGQHTNEIAAIKGSINGLALKSVKEGDLILKTDESGVLSSTLSLNSYKRDGKTYIGLAGIEGAIISEFDASGFVKDGMIDTVVYDTDTKNMTITWNTDSGKQPTVIPMSGLVDTYTAGSGLVVVDNEFSVKLNNSDINKLVVTEDGSLLVDISKDIEAVEASIDTKIDNALRWIDITE